MKRLFVFLFFLVSSHVPAGAQGLHGRILLISDTSSFVPHDMANDVPAIYHGQIDSRPSLPSDLSDYDAVLIQEDGNNDTLSTSDQLALIGYAKNGGKLYLESGSSFPLDTLSHALGLLSAVMYDPGCTI
ncbi:MAG TPA: hypothetical protein VGM92_03100 [Candidatus Kapabacteria bacterium]|jgi:hypothetical protein